MTAVDVVRTAAEAEVLDRPPLLVLDAVEAFLDQHGLGRGPIQATRIGDGQSNVTYRLKRAGDAFVLRRGPRPPLPKSTHDMVREARVQVALRATGMPVPHVLAVCEDDSLLGVPFYVMEHLDGEVVTTRIPADFDSDHDRRRMSTQLVDVLAGVHSVDWAAAGLGSFGKPDGYLRRQVERFARLWDVNTLRDFPAVAWLADWLERNRPASGAPTVVHGDYRLGNLMFQKGSPPAVKAVLDWEMATLGDPVADLGYLVATYAQVGSPSTPLELSPVTRQAGFLTRGELVERYAQRTGRSVEALAWYQVLALWKAAVFCEAIYTRWLRGERPTDTTFGPSLEHGVPRLLSAARTLV